MNSKTNHNKTAAPSPRSLTPPASASGRTLGGAPPSEAFATPRLRFAIGATLTTPRRVRQAPAHRCRYAPAALVLVLGFGGAVSPAARAGSPAPQNAAQNSAAPAATLQLTGTATRFSIDARHADAQDALKAVFDQAGKQFALENNVAGQVTLRLTDQPLNVVLDAVCRQAFLRYRLDAASGISYIERDDDALRSAFSRLRSLDSSLRDQMRMLGLSLPAENAFGINGYGGGNSVLLNGAANGDNLRSGMDSMLGASRRAAKTPSPGNAAAGMGRQQAIQIAPQGPAAGQTPALAQADAQALDTTNVADIQQFLQANNFVSFRIPADKPEPVYTVLQSLGQQARINLLIDPNVPSGTKFTLRGSLSPRPLAEALNILAPPARLEWRWVGNTIFVQTAPDFALFFGEEKEPRARYAPQPALKKLETKDKSEGKGKKEK